MKQIYNVSYITTGNISSANVSFVGVGGSALSFGKVFFIAFTLFGLLFLSDLFALRIEAVIGCGLYSLSIPAFFIMVSGSMINFYSKGAAATLLGVLLFIVFGYSSKDVVMKELPLEGEIIDEVSIFSSFKYGCKEWSLQKNISTNLYMEKTGT